MSEIRKRQFSTNSGARVGRRRWRTCAGCSNDGAAPAEVEGEVGSEARAQAMTATWLEGHARGLWPEYTESVVHAKYVRANTQASDLYVLSTPGGTKHRLSTICCSRATGRTRGRTAEARNRLARRLNVDTRQRAVLADAETGEGVVAAVHGEKQAFALGEDDAARALERVRCALLPADRLELVGARAAREHGRDRHKRAIHAAPEL